MNEINYPWDWAPDWAKFAVTDDNGNGFWCDTEPVIVEGEWVIHKNARCLKIGKHNNLPSDFMPWASLEKRPEKEK
jgi:hypothetical protein